MSIEKNYSSSYLCNRNNAGHPFREGFRSRLENIVRGQVSNPETTSDTGTSDSRHDQRDGSASREVQHENEETDTSLLPERGVNLEGSTAVQNQQVSSDLGSDWQIHISEVERGNHQESVDIDSNEWTQNPSDDTDSNWQDNAVPAWPVEAFSPENQGQNHLQEVPEAWRDAGSGEAAENWSEGPTDSPGLLHSVTSRRGNRFNPPDDDNVYSMELRELLSRSVVLCGQSFLFLDLVLLDKCCFSGGVSQTFFIVVFVRAWII